MNILTLGGLDPSNLYGLLFVYGYVAILLLISEKVLNKHPQLSRKFLHIMVGNILFILPLFNTWWVITFFAAAPFIPLTYLMSPYSPLKSVKDKISSSGHGLGLVYYAISWTILAFLFYNQPWIIAVGIAAMSYGDGMASLVGQRFGKRNYNVFGDNKTYEGSLAMFLTLIITLGIVLAYYGVLPSNYMIIVIVALVATVLEGITPKGLDNLTSCFGAVATYLILTIK
ncbi:MAG: diacylglycerol/polyprenol kinase family protein [Methanobacterium sp.]